MALASLRLCTDSLLNIAISTQFMSWPIFFKSTHGTFQPTVTGAGTTTTCLTSVEVMGGSAAAATTGLVVTVGLVATSLVVGGDNGNFIHVVFCVSIPFLFV